MKQHAAALKGKIFEFKDGKPTKYTVIFILGILGILLLALAPYISDSLAGAGAPQPEKNAQQYAQEMEIRLSQMLGKMEGVGKAEVMVTLKNGYTYTYAVTEKTNTDLLEDVKSGEEKKTQEKSIVEQTYILIDGDGGKTPVITCEMQPQVLGVVVICEGGDEPAVKSRIIEAIKVALDLSSADISVSKLSE